MKDTLWLVGQDISIEENGAWRYIGLFTTEEEAIKAVGQVCECCFVAPVIPDDWSAVNNREQPWPGSYYPLLEDKPKQEVV